MAFGSSTFTDAGAAVSDLFAAQADRAKASFDLAEGQSYQLASQLAEQEKQFTANSTEIKQMQQQRELQMSLGQTRAEVGAAGFAESGSAVDLLRQSASQGALQKAVLGQQGLITEAGYQEQAQSFNIMAGAAQQAAAAENKAALGADIGAGINAVAAIASIF